MRGQKPSSSTAIPGNTANTTVSGSTQNTRGIPSSIYAADVLALSTAFLKQAIIAIEQDAEVRSDSFAFFKTDRVAIQATLQAAFALSHPAVVVRMGQGVAVQRFRSPGK
ncbi:hypothetical protein [Kocuria rosea]|uniref:hypothetical protein n=1 Tax=Kocuria rosea TaxID=1275 RepID=UPI00155861FF|nr:hypothetical protein [Kocuria rosea]